MPCRSALGAVSLCAGRRVAAPTMPPVVTQKSCRDTKPNHARWAPCRTVSLRARCPLSQHKNRVAIQNPITHGGHRVAARMMPLVATQKSCRDTKPYHARCVLFRTRCCACRSTTALRSGQAVSCPGARLRLACRDTILLYRDQSWKMGSSPSSFLSCTFFFYLFHPL